VKYQVAELRRRELLATRDVLATAAAMERSREEGVEHAPISS
jgi:hypothetical protein